MKTLINEYLHRMGGGGITETELRSVNELKDEENLRQLLKEHKVPAYDEDDL